MEEISVVESVKVIEDVGEVVVYGVNYKDDLGKNITYGDISSLRERAERFASLCREKSVGAVNLFDVLEDYVAEL